MSAHVLLNLLNESGKEIKCEACRAFYLFYAISLINSIIQEHVVRFYLSYDIKISLKYHFCRRNVIFFSLCTQRCYGRHNVSQKIDKQLVFYRFYCMALFHSQARRHMIKYATQLCQYTKLSKSKDT